MLNKTEATRIALAEVRSFGLGLALHEEPIASGNYGWVFAFQSAKYLETGDFRDMLVGNAPLLVEKETGKLHTLGTAHPTEYYVDNFTRNGDPHRPD